MSNDRSPDTSGSGDAAPWADAPGAEDKDAPQARGLFGRILDAFGGGETEGEAAALRDAAALQGGMPGMVNLRRMRVDDVAVPKTEIVATSDTISLDELVAMFREHGFSRIPVYKDSLDTPLGLILLKDLALKHGFGGTDAPAFDLTQLLRPLLYVPPSMPLGVLLQQMQQKRIHMAMVIDEFGGVDGLLTIEDLIEQVVGDIDDEHDEIEGDLLIREAPGQWLIQARASLQDVRRGTGLRLATVEEEIDTLGGLIVNLFGRVPELGEVIAHENGARFEIVEADPRRVYRVRMWLPGGEGLAALGDG